MKELYDIRKVFRKISNLEYFVWKDLDSVKRNLLKDVHGDVEFDVLVSDRDQKKFLEVLKNENFVICKNTKPSYLKDVYHAFKFTRFGYYHFHIYPSLLTGNHFSKEFYIDLKDLFNDYEFFYELKCASRELELFFSSLRFLFKQGSYFEKIKKCDQENYDAFLSLENSYTKRYNLIKSNVGCYRYKTRNRVYVENLYYKFLYRLHCKITRSNNKSLMKKKRIAFIGTDGSGKTTISSHIYDNCRRKIPTKKIYLGSNYKNYSFTTWVYYFSYKYFFRIFKIFGDNKLYWYGLSNFEISRVKDTVKRYLKVSKERKDVVIFERFPTPGFLDFPNKLIDNPCISDRKKKLLNDYKIFWCNEAENINMFLITTPIECIVSRRVMGEDELRDIKNKKGIEHQFINSTESSKMNIIENKGSLESTLSEIYEKI
ncbi:hypothetical protein [Vibrio crassostreae]|uniref:hypothetical protein n=1 Tax=Vibrio crassostreae TaxID=246167 RepID=UPI0002E1F140|nr:hypothetical protein [Vibrio crassostreae]OEE90365.1 hypothetical protein A140_03365 [Vibrio crassostreae 9ZC88]